MDRQYIAIDLKSFYASVECVERGLDPLDVCLVVADQSRTDKTICLAVSPALKAYGTGGRPRLFEVVQKVREVNRSRGRQGKSTSGRVLATNPQLAVDYIVVPPRMALYIDYSTRAFNVYQRYVSAEDIHVYSIDEVFIDVTSYLAAYKMTAHELAMRMIRDVLAETGVTATAGIGTNMFLCKVAMDIVAKKMPPDADGVRIAELDERTFREKLWDHLPLTDFWRIGRGTATHLAKMGLYTMGDIARYSEINAERLYREFGVNAELIIDHAWGWEPATIDRVKAYRPETHSLSSGQVLTRPYTCAEARNVVLEMIDSLSLDMIEKRFVTNQLVLTLGHDVENITRPEIREQYHGKIHMDHYGRAVPAHAHGTINLDRYTSSSRILSTKVAELFDRIADPMLLIRRINISANKLMTEQQLQEQQTAEPQQLELFVDYEAMERQRAQEQEEIDKERRRQEAMIQIKKAFGKNAILRGVNFAEGATQRNRNSQIGGHNA